MRRSRPAPERADEAERWAVVVDDVDIAYRAPKIARLVGQRTVDAVAGFFVEPAKRRVRKALKDAGYAIKDHRWREADGEPALSRTFAAYLDWMTLHRESVKCWVDWGHGHADGTLRVFGRDLTGSQLLTMLAPKALDVAVLGACYSNRAGFQPYAKVTVGYWTDTADWKSGAVLFASRASAAIGGRPLSRTTRRDSVDPDGPRGEAVR